MEVIHRVRAMREFADTARRNGTSIGFVPTMGFLHEGHLALVRRAKEACDLTVVSIFVNPTQFGPGEDLARYPRDLARDCRMLEAEDVDVVFAPEAGEIYPAGATTFVEVAGLSDVLEGRSRPGHFRGVATVVLKLVEIVLPDVAVFGQKDAQQVVVVQRMVRDLLLGVEIVVHPTQRDEDGVAMSSRNVYLTPAQRRAARAIPRGLEASRARLAAGETSVSKLLAAAREAIEAEPELRIDYLELVDAGTFAPLEEAKGRMLVVTAVFAGTTRLLDNLPLQV
jgi:pantoate--beta-alanine ligase